jgi:hypothetical protein
MKTSTSLLIAVLFCLSGYNIQANTAHDTLDQKTYEKLMSEGHETYRKFKRCAISPKPSIKDFPGAYDSCIVMFNSATSNLKEVYDKSHDTIKESLYFLLTDMTSMMSAAYRKMKKYDSAQWALDQTGFDVHGVLHPEKTAFYANEYMYNVSHEIFQQVRYNYMLEQYNLSKQFNDSITKVKIGKMLMRNQYNGNYNRAVIGSFLFSIYYRSNMYDSALAYGKELIEIIGNLAPQSVYKLGHSDTDYSLYFADQIITCVDSSSTEDKASLFKGFGEIYERKESYKESLVFYFEWANNTPVVEFDTLMKYADIAYTKRIYSQLKKFSKLIAKKVNKSTDCATLKQVLIYCNNSKLNNETYNINRLIEENCQ